MLEVGGALTLRLGEALTRLLATLEEGEGARGPQRLFLIEETQRGYCDEAKKHFINTSVSERVGGLVGLCPSNSASKCESE